MHNHNPQYSLERCSVFPGSNFEAVALANGTLNRAYVLSLDNVAFYGDISQALKEK